MKVAAEKNAQLTKYFVKFYLSINATGVSATPVYILADANMAPDEIEVYSVAGLGIGTDLAAIGYVVFAKTRCVNEAFYAWWFENVFIKFVMDLRVLHDIPADVPAYFTLDGEDVQLKPLLTEAMAAKCRELHIIVGKPPASTTSVTQPCDAGTSFIGAKTKKKGMKSISDCLEMTMTNRLRAMVKTHEAKIGAPLPAHHVKSIIEGLQVVQYILQSTIRRDTIVHSFKVTGMYDPTVGGCNVDQILGQCRTPFSVKEVARVKEVLPLLSNLMKENGELKEADYEILGFDQGNSASLRTPVRRPYE